MHAHGVPPLLDPALIAGLDLSSFDAFMRSLRGAPREQIQALQLAADEESRRIFFPTPDWIELYHGAPTSPDIAGQILRHGFRLQRGRRTHGFMNAPYTVENLAVFLADSRQLAAFFGNNRADYPGNYQVLICTVDASRVLDSAAIPRSVRRLALDLLEEEEGTRPTRIPLWRWWWLLDQPALVDAIKAEGYTGVRFAEDRAVLREARVAKGHTYAIFDPGSIRVRGRDGLHTPQRIYEWVITTKRGGVAGYNALAQALRSASRSFSVIATPFDALEARCPTTDAAVGDFDLYDEQLLDTGSARVRMQMIGMAYQLARPWLRRFARWSGRNEQPWEEFVVAVESEKFPQSVRQWADALVPERSDPRSLEWLLQRYGQALPEAASDREIREAEAINVVAYQLAHLVLDQAAIGQELWTSDREWSDLAAIVDNLASAVAVARDPEGHVDDADYPAGSYTMLEGPSDELFLHRWRELVHCRWPLQYWPREAFE